MNLIRKITAIAVGLSLMNITACGTQAGEGVRVADLSLSADSIVKSSGISATVTDYSPKALFKAKQGLESPLLTNIFCADPTAVEYNGRLYVYGTNDNQQYLEKSDSDNTYECIKSFVIISTDDMVNWRFEGIIDTASIAPWIYASWAPSVTSRVEEDGLTHFYLYFSNSGAGVGVLTATDPAGPWSDPLGKPLIYAGMPGLTDCPNPFDPGVCIDDDGVGWLAFGGGRASDGTDYLPGSMRICRLGSDMISIDSDFVKIKAPYSFEASELNYIGGTYVYTYNTSWDSRDKWDISGTEAPSTCSMCYMTTKTPLDSDSWEYKGYYLKNPGDLGLGYSNNHTHLQKYDGDYYLLYHTLTLDKELKTEHGFRSLCVAPVDVNEKKAVISECEADLKGDMQIKRFDPYTVCRAETAYLSDCEYVEEDDGEIYVKCSENGVIALKNVDFKGGSEIFAVKVKGKGCIEIRLDSFDSEPAAVISFDCDDFTAVYDEVEIKKVHDVYFVMSGDFEFDEWEFVKK